MSTPSCVKDGPPSAPMSIQTMRLRRSTMVVTRESLAKGGLMLCRIPIETAHERSAYYGLRTREQMQAVDQDLMKESHPSMPIHQTRQSKVSFGGRGSSD